MTQSIKHHTFRKNQKTRGKRLLAAAAAALLAAAPALGADDVSDIVANITSGEETAVPEKEETVYIVADAAGTPDKIIVSDWLKNIGHEELLKDKTSLSEIENLKGDETWSENEDGTIEWKADGNDIYYQGTSSEDLPVSITAHFYLDGEELSPEEISGKSGEVKIRYEYQNHQVQEVELDGQTVSLHVPFAAVTGLMLDSASLSDIQVTGGRLVTDGTRTIALGIAFPGIAEDLDSPAFAALTNLTKAEVPDCLEITGKTENFTWGTSYTLVTDEIFSEESGEITSSIEDIFGKLGALQSGIDQITDGAASLNEGAGELETGAEELAEGLGELTGNNEALQEGAGQIFDGILESVQEQLNAADVPVESLTRENYEEVLAFVTVMAQGEQKEKLLSAKEQLDSVKEFYEGLTAYTDGVSQAKDGAEKLAEGTRTLQAGTSRLLFGAGVLKAAVPDLSGVTAALKESASLGKGYRSYSGLAEGMKGKVRFIWKLDGID